MATKQSDDFRPKSLPLVGRSRWTQIQPFLPVCRETWRTMCRAGKAPKPVRLSPRCTVWDNVEVHRWLADPLGYRAE
jgi:prophage regulatory protein